uniref:Uncharacterized protein n=1 Tax=Arundo donax TaxID=35708 RepID=A0A0A9FUY5_ARUDO
MGETEVLNSYEFRKAQRELKLSKCIQPQGQRWCMHQDNIGIIMFQEHISCIKCLDTNLRYTKASGIQRNNWKMIPTWTLVS